MAKNDFLGTGVKFPVQADPGTGRFALSSGEMSVKESLYLILMTARGERWMAPAFGSNITSYTFMDTSNTMLNLLRSDLSSAILSQEPRISEVEIRFDAVSRRGCLIIHINYTVSAANTRDNLVFPFYLKAGKEAEADGPMGGFNS